ncbi:O-methyltransferase [Bacteroidota bacterium]
MIRARHRKGRGIHPPFAYNFTREVVFGEVNAELKRIEELRKSLLVKRNKVRVSDKGAGSRKIKGEERRSGDVVRHTAVGTKKGQLLGRIAVSLGFPLILELGTGTGFSSMYMGMACPFSKVLTCEGSQTIADLARGNIQQMEINNIEVHNDDFANWLPRILNQFSGEMLVFIDGDHRGEKMMEYCDMIINSGNNKKVIILDDIHWSTDMYQAWKKLIKKDKVSLSLELFNIGIIFLSYPVQQNNFIIRY